MCAKVLNELMVLIVSLVLLTFCAALKGADEGVRVDSPAKEVISETIHPNGLQAKEPSQIREIRMGEHEEFSRLVFDTDGPVSYTINDVDDKSLMVKFHHSTISPSISYEKLSGSVIKEVSVVSTLNNEVNIAICLNESGLLYCHFLLEEEWRKVVLDIYKKKENREPLPVGKIKGLNVNIRGRPSVNSPVIRQADEGEIFKVHSSQQGWYKVLLDDQRIGYISGTYMLLTKSLPIKLSETEEAFPTAETDIKTTQEKDQEISKVKSLEYKVQDKDNEAKTITPVAKKPGPSAPSSEIAPEEVSEEMPGEVPEEVSEEMPREAPEEAPRDKEEFSLNFDDADLFEVIDVLAKALKINYLIDPRVKGTVTIHTTGKIGKEGLFSIMEHVLRINGVALVKIGDLYKILPFSEAQTEPISPIIERGLAETSRPTSGEVVIQIVPLKFVSPMEMVKILKPFLTPGGSIYEVPMMNLLIITDIASNIEKLLQMIRVFDIQIFEKIKVEIFPIENTNAEDITIDLESIFSAYGLLMKDDRVGVKFIPVPRLNSVLTIASNFELLSQAWDWVKKLDQMVELGTNVNVYFVENVKAEDLAQVLNQIYGEAISAAAVKGKAAEGVVLKGKVKVIPDTATNALVILATPEDYKTIVQTIKKLDIVPRQVLIEVLIAEVSLTDDLSYGVGWWLEHAGPSISRFGGRLSGRISYPPVAATEAGILTPPVTPTGLGYQWLDSKGNVRLILTALAEESKLNILSSPNVLVSNNQEATISVGSEVPVVTGVITTGEQAALGAATTSFQYKDTGVILKVTPHINSVGLVSLDISQEYSEPKTVDIGGTTTYEFLKRQASTSVVADKGKTVVMAGLIQEVTDTTRSGIPFLKDIPLLGFLFGKTSRSFRRTELMVLITPHVIMKREEADEVGKEFRDRMREIKKMLRSWPQADMAEPKPKDSAEPPVDRKPEPGVDKKEDILLKGRLIKDQIIKTQPVYH